MAKEQKIDYFDYFINVAELANKQANYLRETFRDFEQNDLQERIKHMHSIEHEADMLRINITIQLIKDFLPPIDREDIMAMTDLYDTVCDAIDDVLLKIYMFNIQTIRKDVDDICEGIVEITDSFKVLSKELRGFRNPDKLIEQVRIVNDIEDKGDKLYLESVHKLFMDAKVRNKDLVAWNDIYDSLENCYDTVENAAELIRSVVIKNS